MKSAFRNKSHTIEFLKTSRDSFSVMRRDFSIISVAVESYDIAVSISINHMPEPCISGISEVSWLLLKSGENTYFSIFNTRVDPTHVISPKMETNRSLASISMARASIHRLFPFWDGIRLPHLAISTQKWWKILILGFSMPELRWHILYHPKWKQTVCYLLPASIHCFLHFEVI